MLDKCGLLGIYQYSTKSELDIKNIPKILKKIQHRGQESYGISYINDNKIKTFKRLGLVTDEFKNELDISISHVRYSTSKNSKNIKKKNRLLETQPLSNITNTFSLAHNGNIPHKVQEKIIKNYKIEQETNSDSETLLRLIEIFYKKYNNISDALIKLINTIEGVYNLLILTNTNEMYILRDRYGIRPLTYTFH